MLTSDVFLFVDQYKIFEESKQRGSKLNPEQMAQTLSQMVKILGPTSESFAIVEEKDKEGMEAYHKANFEVRSMNGDRNHSIHDYINRMRNQVRSGRPKHLVAVTNDPLFNYLFQDAQSQDTELRVFVPGTHIPSVFHQVDYAVRSLSEILNEARPHRYTIFIDYENIHIGLNRNGSVTSPKVLIETIRTKAATLGDTGGNIIAYADWDLLSRNGSINIQRELALMSGVETRYQPNDNGKNSADMKIADDIRTLVEKPDDAPDSADVIILCTGDRDFRPVVDTAKKRNKKVVIFTVQGTLSSELKDAAHEVYYIDEMLPEKARVSAKQTHHIPKPTDEHAHLIAQFMALLIRKNWKYIFANRLEKFLGADEIHKIDQAVKARILIRDRNKYLPNRQHPLVVVTNHLLDWMPWRIREAMKIPNFNYVDSVYLIRGMAHDRVLKRFKVGKNWAEAENWLEIIASTGIVEKGSQPHFKDTNQTVTTWFLPDSPTTKDNNMQQNQENNEPMSQHEPDKLPEKQPTSLRANTSACFPPGI